MCFGTLYELRLLNRAKAEPERADELRKYAAEVRRRAGVWGAIGQAKEGQAVRNHLRMVKKLLSEEDYAAGHLPAPPPYWAFGR